MARPPDPDLASLLVPWFSRAARDLPWRRTRDPYAIWLSEVMLQQTQVVTVIPYYERFLARFPNVHALAAAELPEVLSLWRGLGYYSRARNLHRAAKIVSGQLGGVLPATAEALRQLPGFGRYTAGAVASIAYGQPTPLVDGNVIRVLARIFEVEGDPGTRPVQEQIWSLAAALVSARQPGAFNQALMELGAQVCLPRDPHCLICPVAGRCGARAHGRVGELPSPKARRPRKALTWSAAVVLRRAKVLLARRPERGLFGGLWELPSVPGDGQALQSALGNRFRVGEPFGQVRRTLTHRDLAVDLFHVTVRTAPEALAPYRELRWASRDEAEKLGMSSAMSACLEVAWGGGGLSQEAAGAPRRRRARSPRR